MIKKQRPRKVKWISTESHRQVWQYKTRTPFCRLLVVARTRRGYVQWRAKQTACMRETVNICECHSLFLKLVTECCMAALDIRHDLAQPALLPIMGKQPRSIESLLTHNLTPRWWHRMAGDLKLPNRPFSSLPNTASLSLLEVNSLITDDDFMYPIYGTGARITC